MNNKLGLMAKVIGQRLRGAQHQQARKLFTRYIYPYPNYYYQQVDIKSMCQYREIYTHPPWVEKEIRIGGMLFTAFWAWFFFQLFEDPGAVIGHFYPPNPSDWTDEELGIPPMEAGSYRDWLEKRIAETGRGWGKNS